MNVISYTKQSTMKDSGVDWLGDIPSSWKVVKLRFIADITTGDKDTENNEPDGQYPFYVRSQTVERISSFSHDGEAILTAGDGVGVCKVWHYALGKFDFHQRVYMLYNFRDVDGRYLFHYIKNNFIHDVLKQSLKSTVDSLRRPMFLDFPVALPAMEDQKRIAAFLDHQTGLIDELIEKNTKLLELLDDQRKAIINEAVTKGLDPKAPMKDSGVEWLGEVPKGWAVGTLKHLLDGKLTYGANEAADEDNPDDPRYIRITDFDNDGRLRSDTYRSLPPAKAQDYLLEVGDVLFARSGATVGKTFMYTDGSHEACFAGYLIRARCDRSVLLPEFLYLFTKSTNYENWKNSVFNQATIQNIGADKYAQLVLPLPTTAEQEEIIAYLEKVDGDIQRLRDLVIDQGKTLEEYRQSLISEAVTGKIDLREWVPAPQQTVEP